MERPAASSTTSDLAEPQSKEIMSWTIYFDDIQEGVWFAILHPRLKDAELRPIN